ncbi:MAG: hypothetical protein Q7R62_02810, partial [bacterium]|nr:hypothetical protein [bacterium]
SILTVAVFAIFSLLTRSTSLNRVISQQYVATYLAAEGLELVKNITASNNFVCGTPWNTGAEEGPHSVDYLSDELGAPTSANLKINADGFYQYGTGEPSPFSRTVMVDLINTSERSQSVEMRVTSIVKWRGRGGVESEVKLEDHFFNWRPQPEC